MSGLFLRLAERAIGQRIAVVHGPDSLPFARLQMQWQDAPPPTSQPLLAPQPQARPAEAHANRLPETDAPSPIAKAEPPLVNAVGRPPCSRQTLAPDPPQAAPSEPLRQGPQLASVIPATPFAPEPVLAATPPLINAIHPPASKPAPLLSPAPPTEVARAYPREPNADPVDACDVHIHIGRVEVTAVQQKPATPNTRACARPRPGLSLEDYLARRRGDKP